MDIQDVIFGIFLITGTYVGSAVFAILLFRAFFPVKAKAIGKGNSKYSYASRNGGRFLIKKTDPVSAVDGRRDWVKISA